ncbi:MAG TPA: DMT family transporter [Acidimicrobiia bacterium]
MTTVAALVGAVIISFSAIFYSLSGADAITGGFFRVAFAVPVLAVIWWTRRDRDQRPLRHRVIAFAAGIAFGLDMTTWHTSIHYIGAGLATLIANTQVVLVAIAAWLFFGDKPRKLVLAAIPVVLLGVALVSGLGQGDAYGEDPLRGTLLALAAAVFYTIFILVMKFANTSRAPASGPLLDVSVGGVISMLVIGAIGSGIDFELTWPSAGWLVALALGPQVTAWLLIGYALPRLPASETATIVLLQPALTMVWGASIFSERPSALQIVGAVVVLLGVALVALSANRSRAETPLEPERV